MQDNTEQPYERIWKSIKKYLSFQAEYCKYTAAEKLTIVFTAMAIVMICILLSAFAFFYLMSTLMYVLQPLVGFIWSNFIIAGIFIILMVVIIVLRRPLIQNPVAKFVSKLIIDDPNDTTK